VKRYRTVKQGNDVAVVDEVGKCQSLHPTREQADIRLKALHYPEVWRKRIASALPAKLEPDYRAGLTTRIAELIETWHSIHPQIAPHREKLKKLSGEARRLRAALERLNTGLLDKFGDNGRGEHCAEGALRGIVGRTVHALTAWNRSWLPSNSRPPEFSVNLVSGLRDEFHTYCGKSARGFAALLNELQREKTQQLLEKYRGAPKLPSLKTDAMHKRKRRRVDKLGKK
jgi:hypothetical protein